MQGLIECGLYKIKNEYFARFPSQYWMDNKNEKRPHYYLLTDKDGVMWVIPMSSQVDNYRNKIQREEDKRGEGNCLYYHIGVVASKERVFLVGDMFPVGTKDIKSPYLIGQQHYIVKNKSLNRAIYSKSMRYLKLLEQGVMTSRNNVMGIKKILLSEK